MGKLCLTNTVSRLAYFPVATEKFQYVAAAASALMFFVLLDFTNRFDDRAVWIVIAVIIQLQRRAIPDINGISTTRHFDNRCIIEVPRETLHINSGRGNNNF